MAPGSPGDPRGFRTRDHRLHVDGDYKNPPPPGQHDPLHQSARRSLKQEIITIARVDRGAVAMALRDHLIQKGATLAIVGVLGRHAHLLAKLPPKLTRRWVGEAKKHATFQFKSRGLTGRLWGGGGKFVPIDNRSQQVRVYRYIERHEEQGACIWRYRDGVNRD